MSKKTTALAKRRAPQPARAVARRAAPRPLAPLPAIGAEKLTDEITIGALGLVPITLSQKAEAILARAPSMDDVLIKPSGQPYLSHPAYTRWFNEAFGRLRWAIVPLSKPMKNGNTICQPYMLHVDGKPVAYAMGEQEYYGQGSDAERTNREQTYGDAVEATVASALRRIAKRMGVGLELWDKAWLARFVRDYCVKVRVKSRNEDRPRHVWRLKTADRFWNEIDARTGEVNDDADDEGGARPAQRREAPRGGYDGSDDRVVSSPQIARLWAIATNAGRSDEQVRDWLSRIGYPSAKEIPRGKYDRICNLLKSGDRLPETL